MPQISPMKWSMLSILMQISLYSSLIWASFKKLDQNVETTLNKAIPLSKMSWKW